MIVSSIGASAVRTPTAKRPVQAANRMERDVDTESADCGDRNTFHGADQNDGGFPPADQKDKDCEPGLPNHRSEPDPEHLVVRLKEPLQQERAAQQAQSVKGKQSLQL